jgi:hypothetical protein
MDCKKHILLESHFDITVHDVNLFLSLMSHTQMSHESHSGEM